MRSPPGGGLPCPSSRPASIDDETLVLHGNAALSLTQDERSRVLAAVQEKEELEASIARAQQEMQQLFHLQQEAATLQPHFDSMRNSIDLKLASESASLNVDEELSTYEYAHAFASAAVMHAVNAATALYVESTFASAMNSTLVSAGNSSGMNSRGASVDSYVGIHEEAAGAAVQKAVDAASAALISGIVDAIPLAPKSERHGPEDTVLSSNYSRRLENLQEQNLLQKLEQEKEKTMKRRAFAPTPSVPGEDGGIRGRASRTSSGERSLMAPPNIDDTERTQYTNKQIKIKSQVFCQVLYVFRGVHTRACLCRSIYPTCMN